MRGKRHVKHIHQDHQQGEVQADAYSGIAHRKDELGFVLVVLALFFRAVVDRFNIIQQHVGKSFLIVHIGAEEAPQRVFQIDGTTLFRGGNAFARAVFEVAPEVDIHCVGKEIGEIETRDLQTGESEDRQGHVRGILAVEIVNADGQRNVAGGLVDLRDLKEKLRLLAVLQVEEHFHMDTQTEVGMRFAVVDHEHGGIVLGQTEHITQHTVESDRQDVVAAGESKVDGRRKADLHLVNERISKITGDLCLEVVRALEGGVLRRVGFDHRLRLETGQHNGYVVLTFLAAGEFYKGLFHTGRRRGFEFRAQVGKVLIAQIGLISQHQQQIIVNVGIQNDHTHLVADLYGG